MFMRTKLALAAATAIALFTTSTYAEHWDRPSCYIDVHDGCYNNTSNPCTKEEYEGLLDNCDTTYPKNAILELPASLTIGEQSPSLPLKRR